jgi:ubiquitin-activating enzyme E1
MSESRYSRQILTLGKQAQKSLSQSRVLVINLELSLAMEVLKNLVLQGVGTIYLQDDNLISSLDETFGFYYHQEFNKKRTEVLISKLQKLNPSVLIKPYQNEPIDITINLSSNKITSRNQIYSNVLNNRGFIFNDFGKHQINDIDGETPNLIPIKNISEGLIETIGYHNLSTDYQIIFENLIGENLEFLNKTWNIKVISPTLLKLEEFPETDLKFISGYLKRFKSPQTLEFKSIEEELTNPTLPDDIFHPDFPKEQFDFWMSKPKEELSPIHVLTSAYFGGLIANETIKFLTKNHQPFNQWYFWEDKSLILPKDLDKKIFMVGSGAIGCEVLKNLVMLGIKDITITDPDTIEESNLSRQFLFNYNHLNQSKSHSAKETIETLRNDLKITALTDKMSKESESKFNDEFYQNLDVIFNALDNLPARLYMDSQAVKYHLPLFESGTQGTKGNTQPVIPNLTEHYGATQESSNEESYPICTVKNFPNKPEHTIHWASEKFEYLFTEFPSQVNKYLDDNEYLNTLPEHDKNKLINEMNRFFGDNYLDYILDLYHNYFYHQIHQLLHNFPEDKLNDDGTLFWSNGKRCPQPIKDEFIKDFFLNTFFLICEITEQNGRIYSTLDDEINEKLLNLKPKITEKVIAKDDSELKNEKEDLTSEILKVKPFRLKVISYDKDDETHSEWVHLSSTLRNKNYQITPIDKLETRRISGKIIPALATTTSMVSALICIEMCKYFNQEKLENYRSYFINSAINQYLYSEPNPPKKTKLNNLEITIWDKFEEKEDLTVKEFLEKWSKKFNSKLNMIVKDSEMIYSELFSEEEILNQKLSTLITKPTTLLVASDEEEEFPSIYF